MLQTAGRLTLYGLISSFDSDLRRLVRNEVLEQVPLNEAIPSDLFEILQKRALKDGQTDELEFIDYLDFGDSLKLLRKHQSILSNSLSRLIRRHGEHFDKLIPVRNRVMHARPILLSDYPVADSIAKIVREFPSSLFPFTREFDDRIRRDPHHVFSIDASAISRDDDRIPNNLPLPDFDETGFVGREKEQADLKRLCRSQWPVITVVGEGGYGKTALALQVAYDILDDEESDFDAIVWTTAKRIKLTNRDIETIDDAISSSLGVIKSAATELSGNENSTDPFKEVISYLNNFKILLIIDNLETILDPLLVEFLRELNGRSKVLTTSRVGVGQLSYSFPLEQMQLKDAVRLLRTLARARHIDDLAKAKAPALETYCKKMKLNAGFIKWFVTSVQYGKRPDQVLANPKVFLDFCVSYVFEHVSEDAKLVTKAMLAAPGKQSLPLISYLTGLTGDSLELALASLQSANILKMSTAFGESFSDTVYELSELPRLYILKNHPPSLVEDAEFKRRKREVVAIYDRLQSEGGAYKYRTTSVACRSPSDSVLARMLVTALDLANRDQMDAAMEKVRQAIALDPSFSESYRVEALLYQRSENNIAAEESYQTAIELEPKSAPLRYRYANFILRALHDPESALVQLKLASSFDPDNPRINLDAARCLLYLGNVEEAQHEIAKVLTASDLEVFTGRMALNVHLQIAVKWLQNFLAGQQLKEDFRFLYRSVDLICASPDEWFDSRVCTTLNSFEHYAREAASAEDERSLPAAIERTKLKASSCQFGAANGFTDEKLALAPHEGGNEKSDAAITNANADAQVDERVSGKIDRVFLDRNYGFITGPLGDIFFHLSQANPREYVAAGAEVTFRTSSNAVGRPVAVKIKVSAPIPQILNRARLTGHVKQTATTFGFIFGEDGHDYFFHQSGLINGVKMNEMKIGAHVIFTASAAAKGPQALEIELRD